MSQEHLEIIVQPIVPLLYRDGNHSFIYISAGTEHSLALKNDGTLWVWGGNAYGQLGDGTRTHKSSPTVFPYNKFIKYMVDGIPR